MTWPPDPHSVDVDDKDATCLEFDSPGGHYSARVVRCDVTLRQGEECVLWWTDYVANEWFEMHADLPSAIARLGLLEAAVKSDAFFTSEPDGFDADWAKLVQEDLALLDVHPDPSPPRPGDLSPP